MHYVATVNSLLADYANELGLDHLELDSDHRVSLLVGDIPLTLALTAEPIETLWIVLELGRLDVNNLSQAAWLLQANLGLGTRQILTLGIGIDQTTIQATNSLYPKHLTYRIFRERLNEMLKASFAIHQKLLSDSHSEIYSDTHHLSAPGSETSAAHVMRV